MKRVDNMTNLRKELNKIPKSRLQFLKSVTDFLASNDLQVTSDLLGKLTIAHCNEVEGVINDSEGEETWTD